MPSRLEAAGIAVGRAVPVPRMAVTIWVCGSAPAAAGQ